MLKNYNAILLNSERHAYTDFKKAPERNLTFQSLIFEIKINSNRLLKFCGKLKSLVISKEEKPEIVRSMMTFCLRLGYHASYYIDYKIIGMQM